MTIEERNQRAMQYLRTRGTAVRAARGRRNDTIMTAALLIVTVLILMWR